MHLLIEVRYEEDPQKMMVRRLVQCAVQILQSSCLQYRQEEETEELGWEANQAAPKFSVLLNLCPQSEDLEHFSLRAH